MHDHPLRDRFGYRRDRTAEPWLTEALTTLISVVGFAAVLLLLLLRYDWLV